MKSLIYHHLDNDGYLSAAIADMFLRQCETGEIRYAVGDYEGNYCISDMDWADRIFLLDYSLPNDLMDRYFDKLIWIDHHETAIKVVGIVEAQHGKNLAGKREVGKSGCLLSWEWFVDNYADKYFPDPDAFELYWPGKKPPLVVELVNDRDVWVWNFGEDTASFHEASRMFVSNLVMWQSLLRDSNETRVQIQHGKKLLGYIRDVVDTYIESFAWTGSFFGYPAVYLNGSGIISGELHKRAREHNTDCALAVIFMWTKDDQIKVSLYRNEHYYENRKEKMINVSALAQKFGGGGHKGAAGFYISPAQWVEITALSHGCGDWRSWQDERTL